MRGVTRLWSRGDGRSSSLGTVKKVLLSLLVVGLLGTVTGRGVEAALNSESVNTQSTVSSGTLALSTQIQGQSSACTSDTASSNDNANVTCTGTTGLLFNGATLRWPASGTGGDSIPITVINEGTIAAQSLEVTMTCVNGNKSTAGQFPGGTGGTTVDPAKLPGTEGTGVPCGVSQNPPANENALQFYIQETTSLGGTDATNGCLYPDTSSPHVPGAGNATDCTTQWTTDSLRKFWVHGCWDLGPVGAASTRYFTVGVRFPPDSDNTYQGTQAFIKLKWHLVSNDPLYTPGCFNDN